MPIKPPRIKNAVGREAVPSATSVRQAIAILSKKLGLDSEPSFAEVTVTGLTPSRLVAADGDKQLVSVSDLTAWIAGTTNQFVVTDDGDGTLTGSLPQDIHVDATPEWAGTTIKDSGDNIIFFVDDDEMYFTAGVAIPIAAGHGMPWLFWFTYAAP